MTEDERPQIKHVEVQGDGSIYDVVFPDGNTRRVKSAGKWLDESDHASAVQVWAASFWRSELVARTLHVEQVAAPQLRLVKPAAD